MTTTPPPSTITLKSATTIAITISQAEALLVLQDLAAQLGYTLTPPAA